MGLYPKGASLKFRVYNGKTIIILKYSNSSLYRNTATCWNIFKIRQIVIVFRLSTHLLINFMREFRKRRKVKIMQRDND